MPSFQVTQAIRDSDLDKACEIEGAKCRDVTDRETLAANEFMAREALVELCCGGEEPHQAQSEPRLTDASYPTPVSFLFVSDESRTGLVGGQILSQRRQVVSNDVHDFPFFRSEERHGSGKSNATAFLALKFRIGDW